MRSWPVSVAQCAAPRSPRTRVRAAVRVDGHAPFGSGSRWPVGGLKSARGGSWRRRRRMGLARIISSATLALVLAGGALAQQAAPAPDVSPPLKEYNQQILVPGSWFHGVHGL